MTTGVEIDGDAAVADGAIEPSGQPGRRPRCIPEVVQVGGRSLDRREARKVDEQVGTGPAESIVAQLAASITGPR